MNAIDAVVSFGFVLALVAAPPLSAQGDTLDPLAKQSEMFAQRIRMLAQQETLTKHLYANNTLEWDKLPHERKDDILIENSHKAYNSLNGLAASVAKEFDCAGKNIVIYGPGQSDELLSLKAFNDLLAVLHGRLQSILDIAVPNAPEKSAQGAGSGVYGVAQLAGPLQQSVLDLVAFFHSSGALADDTTPDEKGLVAVIASAAVTQGCLVYWPGQYVTNPFDSSSQIMSGLGSLADLNDNGGIDGKAPGLQQRIRALRIELKRAQLASEALRWKMQNEDARLAAAVKRTDFLKDRIDWLTENVKENRNTASQEKLNTTFNRSWSDLETALRRQLTAKPPQTIEEQNQTGEMMKRLDILKTRTDWLAQYVKDEKVIVMQDKLKVELATAWEAMDAATKELEALTISVPKTIEPDRREQERWDKYATELKELITTSEVASEAYSTFRGAALDGGAGATPLSRILRAEALRNLTFDDKFQARPGATVVQLRLQKLGGTYVTQQEREDFSGGVVLSYVQFEPGGKLRKSGVRSAYAGFKANP